MTTFSFVFTLYSVIASLSLAHMLSGLVAITRGRSHVRYSLAHALWIWAAFALVLGNWQSQWELREMQDWPAWSILILISNVVIQFVFCAYLTPEVKADEDIDLVAFHDCERRRYIGAFLTLIAVSFVYNVAFGVSGAYGSWLRDNTLTLIACGLGLIAFFFNGRNVQVGVAFIVAVIATIFLVVASNIVDASPREGASLETEISNK